MQIIKKILVGLDLSPMDKHLIEHVAFITKSTPVEDITFVNIIKNLDISDDVLKEFPDLKKGAIKEREDNLKKEVETFFKSDNKVNIHFKVHAGRGAKSMLGISEQTDADLIVLGCKTTSRGKGVLVTRLARRAGCNLLMIPEGRKPHISKLLVPIDFSSHAKQAIEHAIDVAIRYEGNIEIFAQNVFSVPTGYHYSGKTYEEFAEIMKQHAQKDYENFISKIETKGVKITPIYNLDTNENLVSDINDLADEIHPDCIFIGAKGRTATTAIFLGSFAEKLLSYQIKYPILVVRPKGEKTGFIDYLKEISK